MNKFLVKYGYFDDCPIHRNDSVFDAVLVKSTGSTLSKINAF